MNTPAPKVVCIPAGTIKAIDPETQAEVELEVMKDPTTNAMLAIDSTYLDQVSLSFRNPFEDGVLTASEETPGALPVYAVQSPLHHATDLGLTPETKFKAVGRTLCDQSEVFDVHALNEHNETILVAECASERAADTLSHLLNKITTHILNAGSDYEVLQFEKAMDQLIPSKPKAPAASSSPSM